jgi:hypothetical protein
MARLLNDKIRRKQAAMYWTRACCKQKTAMGGRRWCCHEYRLSGYRLRLCEDVYNNAVECLSELLRQCDTSTIKTRGQPHSKVRHLIPTPRINAELSEELLTEPAMVDSKASLLGVAHNDTMVGVIEGRVAMRFAGIPVHESITKDSFLLSNLIKLSGRWLDQTAIEPRIVPRSDGKALYASVTHRIRAAALRTESPLMVIRGRPCPDVGSSSVMSWRSRRASTSARSRSIWSGASLSNIRVANSWGLSISVSYAIATGFSSDDSS